MNQTINNLLTEQLASWETARNNYAALSGVQVKELDVNGIPYKVQFNPARIVSSGAKVDAQSIKERNVFLCPAQFTARRRKEFRSKDIIISWSIRSLSFLAT